MVLTGASCKKNLKSEDIQKRYVDFQVYAGEFQKILKIEFFQNFFFYSFFVIFLTIFHLQSFFLRSKILALISLLNFCKISLFSLFSTPSHENGQKWVIFWSEKFFFFKSLFKLAKEQTLKLSAKSERCCQSAGWSGGESPIIKQTFLL